MQLITLEERHRQESITVYESMKQPEEVGKNRSATDKGRWGLQGIQWTQKKLLSDNINKYSFSYKSMYGCWEWTGGICDKGTVCTTHEEMTEQVEVRIQDHTSVA